MYKTLDKWKEKLLDTGKGNKLINYKLNSSKNLEVLSPYSDNVFYKILNNKTFTCFNTDEKISEYKESIDSNLSTKDIYNLLLDDINNKKISRLEDQLVLYNAKSSTQSTLKNLYKTTSTFLEEKGINVLHLAMFFLEWYDANEKIHLSSPLLLIPLVMTKDSVTRSFTFRKEEDEIITNPTLVYKLKNEFHLDLPIYQEDPYPEETLSEYLDRVYEFAIEYKWKLSDRCAISCFSFNKINIYKDIEENAPLITVNPLVQKLLNKNNEIIPDEEIDNLDDIELKLHNVVDADTSQLLAIQKAKMGKSFVLQGPPGTGKSQTITNLIAELLHDGKKVLFVSEKMAALNVVFNNLKKVGLSRFCLELHSHKSNKKEVINSLFKELQSATTSVNPDAQEQLDYLIKNKNTLDTYAEILHTKIPSVNKTPYEIIDYLSQKHTWNDIEYLIPNISDKNSQYLYNILDVLNTYAELTESIGYDYRDNCLYGFNRSEITYEDKINLKNLLADSLDQCDQISDIIDIFNQTIGLNTSSIKEIVESIEYIQLITNLSEFDSSFFYKSKLASLVTNLTEYNSLLKTQEVLEDEIEKTFSKDIFDIDMSELLSKFKSEYSSVFRGFNIAYRKDVRTIKNYLINPKQKLNYQSILSILTKCVEFNKNKVTIDKIAHKITIATANGQRLLQDSFNLEKQLTQLQSYQIKDNVILASLKENEFRVLQNRTSDALDQLHNIININQLAELAEYFDSEIINFASHNIHKVCDYLTSTLDNIENINVFAKLNATLTKINDYHIKNYLIQAIDSSLPIDALCSAFERQFYKQYLSYYITQVEELNIFSSERQYNITKAFKQKDKLKFEISKAEIVSKLTHSRPNLNDTYEGSQVAILKREAFKKTRQKPVRTLLSEIDELSQILKPCFLMSPLSVSTYLNGSDCEFDVAIFDEASQIFPWDALGSIYRVNQVIIVGDSKQMPPSNFFNNSVFNDDDLSSDDDSLDFESILDLGLATFSTESLKWHYRSKTEELITFSNKHFYNGNLVSFPLANKYESNMGVEYIHVDGVYNRKTNQNIIEANKVVELIFEHFDTHPKRSLGIVAFSISQQEAIENALTIAREKNPNYEQFFDSSLTEPFFIKNLETVQGDERDTIIFSVGYGRDSSKKFLHNFGPLNKQGGERRLNVAITRAKYNVKLVASIHSSDIDLKKSQMMGTILLKDYLHFAEFSHIDNELVNTDNVVTNIEQDIKSFLESNGYEVDTNIGSSIFKISLAVKNPDNDKYMCAIETDGYNYAKAQTTRERERLRADNLERFGWKFYRVWSIDWFTNKTLTGSKLLKYLENVRMSQIIDIPSNTNSPTPDFINVDKSIESVGQTLKTYKYFDADKFYLENGKRITFDNIIEPLIACEQPITETLLHKRLANIFEGTRITQDYKYNLYYAINAHKNINRYKDYYCLDKNISTELRVPAENDEPRKIEYISLYELASGLKKIITNNVGINKDGLFKAIIKLLGHSKTTDKIHERLEKSLNILIENKEIQTDGIYYFKRK